MNELKISTQVNSKVNQRLVVKFDMEKLNVGWKKEDVIRVISFKKENRLILKRVSQKNKKQVSYCLTSSGSNSLNHSLGIYITQKNRRFKKLKEAVSVNVGMRMIDKNQMEVYLPNEIFN